MIDQLERAWITFTNLDIPYKWFFSAASQSLAALIGIFGMFIIYRLQIQQNNIREDIKKLQQLLAAGTNKTLFYLTESQVIKRTEDSIRTLGEEGEHLQKKIPEAQNNPTLKKLLVSNLDDLTTKLEALQETYNFYKGRSALRTAIKIITVISLVILISLFMFSLGGVLYSEHLASLPNAHDKIWKFINFLVFGLAMILANCIICLDIFPIVASRKKRKKDKRK